MHGEILAGKNWQNVSYPPNFSSPIPFTCMVHQNFPLPVYGNSYIQRYHHVSLMMHHISLMMHHISLMMMMLRNLIVSFDMMFSYDFMVCSADPTAEHK